MSRSTSPKRRPGRAPGADRRKEEVLRLLFARKSPADIAREVRITPATLAAWFADPAFVARARRAFASNAVELLPLALDRLKSLVDAEKETTALAAIRLVVRLAELAGEGAATQDDVADRLAKIIDDVLAEVLGADEGNIHAFAAKVKGKNKDVAADGDKGTA